MFVTPEEHHIASEKMARIDAIEESHYHDRGDQRSIIKFCSFSDLIWIYLKLCGVPIRKDSAIKGNSLWH